VLEGDLRFRVGLLSFIDGGVIGHLLRGEPNILTIVMTGDLKQYGTIPVEIVSNSYVESLSSLASEVVAWHTDVWSPGFADLYISPAVASEVGTEVMKAGFKNVRKSISDETANLRLRKRLNRDRIDDLGVATLFAISECVRGVAVGYHEANIFESCWSGSFMNRDATQPDIAMFPGGWSLGVPTDWIGISLAERSLAIVASIRRWAQSTEPPKLTQGDLQKIQEHITNWE
jgi:hypothetical protein